MRRLIGLFLILASSTVQAELVVLMYHHVAEDTPASTTVSPTQFDEHLQLIESLDMTVVDLVDAIEALKAGETLPDKAVAITFDDAWRDIYDNAHPRLQARDWPYTVFVNTGPIDEGQNSAMTWDMLRTLDEAGVRILNHTTDHRHLVHEQFNNDQWLAQSLNSIDAAQARLEAELGPRPKYLAYPYGEYNLALTDALAERGYTAFGQHSGAVSQQSNWQSIARFPAAGIYANPKTLRNKLLSVPFDFAQWPMPSPIVAEGDDLSLTLTFNDPIGFYKGFFQCFFDGEAYNPTWDGRSASIALAGAGEYGRHRINCTAPAGEGRFYWFSQPFLGHRQQSFPDY